jgi:hypothetical protein
MGKRLNAEVTAVTFSEVAHALEAAWTERLGRAPRRESLCLLLAQSALETGHWKTAYCHNLGNAKASPAWKGDHCFYPADEIVDEHRAAQALALRAPRTDGVAGHDVELTRLRSGQVQVTLHPDHPWCRFRAFDALQEGARDYLDLLLRRFEGAWSAVEAGDPKGFVCALHELHYFTTSVERYLPPLQQLFTQFSKTLAGPASPSPVTEAAPVLPAPVNKRPTLRRGARGPFVAEMQLILARAGYAGVAETGTFDEPTLKAVELFQLQHIDERGRPLASDGIVGKSTWWALLNPSGDAQRSRLGSPRSDGLTSTRKSLLALLDTEHAKPVFESPDGSNRSRDIDRYFGKTGILGQPWCCAFVSWALREALGTFPVGGKHHVSVQGMWVAARELEMEVRESKPGDVFIQIKSGGTGHTGFVVGVSADGETVYTCEGNAGNRLKYGQRPLGSIHHFIDCIRDGQGSDFPRGQNLIFEDLGADTTR